ncbi:MAG: GTPase ObgE [Acidimicrobiia bacterium]
MSSFVDEAGLHVKGGDGGAGSVAFRREAHVPKGGPDGGDGGGGGGVWLVADRNIASLLAFRDHPHRRAVDGVHGKGKRQHGRGGDDLMVPVPEGTVVLDPATGSHLADLVNAGDRWLAADGGRGGRGNARFLSNRRRAPSFAEQGEPGEERWLRLELKLLADVALVGFPNVGKSTLVSRVSAARPKIADYPFTTLEPNLGVVRLDDAEFVVADIPGLIEGASEGRGLGHRFLRHIERARVLCVLVDLAWEVSGAPPPAEQRRVLDAELGRYQPDLLDRPRVTIGSRADIGVVPDDPEDYDLVISAVTGEGIGELTGRLASLVTATRAAEPAPSTFVVHRPLGEGFRVERDPDGHGWRVVGRQAERAVALSDLTNTEALAYAQERLRKLGVDRALGRAGVGEGDLVKVGGFEFEYIPDDVVGGGVGDPS